MRNNLAKSLVSGLAREKRGAEAFAKASNVVIIFIQRKNSLNAAIPSLCHRYSFSRPCGRTHYYNTMVFKFIKNMD
jgi:hypothetical protein